MKKFQSLAAALAVGLGGLVGAGHALAQDNDTTIVRDTPNGVVTKHIDRRVDENGVVHRTVRVRRPDGSVVIRHVTRMADADGDSARVVRRTTVVHRHWDPVTRSWVRVVEHRPGYVANRHVTIIHDAG
jgi:hypothetical protein